LLLSPLPVIALETMPQEASRGKDEIFKNLKLDAEFFNRMLCSRQGGSQDESEEFRDFDVYLMEKSAMPLLLQGLDALSRHLDSVQSKGSSSNSKTKLNPLVWLAQYLLRNHPRYVKDHRTPMYDKFAELANIERGRRCLLRRKDQMEDAWHELEKENAGQPVTLADIPAVFKRLDDKWFLEGYLLEQVPKDFSNSITLSDVSRRPNEVFFTEFFEAFEDFVKKNDILRADAFLDAERKQSANAQNAIKAREDEARRARAMKEAMEQRTALEEQFKTVTAEMYINSDISRIVSKGAVIVGVEEKEGGPPLQGEHISLIRLMLGIWGCPVIDDSDGDVWNDIALAAWQQWLKGRDLSSAEGVDKQSLRRLIDKDEFEKYLQLAFPVRDGDQLDDEFAKQVVEVRRVLEDEVDIVVEAIDEDTGEVLRLALPDHEVETLRQRLQASNATMPVLAMADRVSGRIIGLMPATEQMIHH